MRHSKELVVVSFHRLAALSAFFSVVGSVFVFAVHVSGSESGNLHGDPG